MISTLIDGARVGGATLEINLWLRRAPRLAARCVACDAIQIFRGFNESTGRQWMSARRPVQYFLINTSKAIDATSAEYIISSAWRWR